MTILNKEILHLQLFMCVSPTVFERSMEETVRTLLQNQDSLEGPKVDPLDLMKAYKVHKVLYEWYFPTFQAFITLFPPELNQINENWILNEDLNLLGSFR